jgi:hypothetical protein
LNGEGTQLPRGTHTNRDFLEAIEFGHKSGCSHSGFDEADVRETIDELVAHCSAVAKFDNAET